MIGGEILSRSKQAEVIITYERTGKSEYRVITDKKTGETIAENWVTTTNSKPGRSIKKQDPHFIKLYRTNLIDIVDNKRLDLIESGFLFKLLRFVGWQTPYIIHPKTKHNMNATEIADVLKLSRTHVTELLERLTQKGIIVKIIRGNGRPNNYMLNTNITFYGKTIDDLKHVDVFKGCAYEPALEIKYSQTIEKKK